MSPMQTNNQMLTREDIATQLWICESLIFASESVEYQGLSLLSTAREDNLRKFYPKIGNMAKMAEQ